MIAGLAHKAEPIFADTEHFYVCAQAFFRLIQAQEPTAADAILASRLVIHLRCTEPDAELTINGRQRPAQVTYGPTRLRPTLTIELAANTFHQIMVGQQSMTKALVEGLLKVEGPVWKTRALADLFYRGQELYVQALASC